MIVKLSIVLFLNILIAVLLRSEGVAIAVALHDDDRLIRYIAEMLGDPGSTVSDAIQRFKASIEICRACDTGQTKQGCLIRNLVCSCGYGCASDYRYDTYQECQSALRGKKRDICKTNNPCMHNSTCIQISQQPGYKCRCEGTGFFGLRCSRACPVPGAGRVGTIFPYECIVI